MKVLIDANLSWRLGEFLRSAGWDPSHVNSLRMGLASDTDIWSFALREKYQIILTQDIDYSNLVMNSEQGPAVIWLRIGNQPNAVVVGTLSGNWDLILSALQRGERLIEIR
jgi:predicted nuclease of predicted toxin-antitoxin system